MHLFISPHLDDAVLSCGGLIHQLTKRGEAVRVVTLTAGDPPTPLPHTPLIADLHQRWSLGESPIAGRRAEDAAALTHLGAAYVHLPYPDCPYRTDASGQPLYHTNNDLFGAVHPDDPALALSLDIPPETTAIYAPLGAGGHVDHQIGATIGRRLALSQSVAVFFYEEYPYSASGGEAVRITYNSGVQRYGSEAVQAALAAFSFPVAPRVIPLEAADVQAKIEAILRYASQISTFWDSAEDVAARVWAYGAEIAPPAAERVWTGHA